MWNTSSEDAINTKIKNYYCLRWSLYKELILNMIELILQTITRKESFDVYYGLAAAPLATIAFFYFGKI